MNKMQQDSPEWVEAKKKELQKFLEKKGWQPATSEAYKNSPHEYTLLSKREHGWKSKKSMISVARFIRKYGVREMYYRTPFMVMYLGEYKYWTMGPDHELDQIRGVNRCDKNLKYS